MKYDIHNPTPARRIIYLNLGKDLKDQKRVSVEASQTLRGVELPEETVKELEERELKAPGKDLKITPSSGDEVVEPPVGGGKGRNK